MTEGTAVVQQRLSQVPQGTQRFVWDPVVHDTFEENCYFYIIRTSDPERSTTLAPELEAKLLESGVLGVTGYVLFGYYDALIRVWANEGVRRRIVRTLRDLRNIIEDLAEFRVDLVNYTFAQGHPSEDAINSLIPQIEQVLEAETLESYSRNAEESFQKLVSNSVVHAVPSTEGIPFYLLFKRLRERQLTDEEESDRLITSSSESNIQAVSVYSGLGSFAHLVSGVAPGFAQLLPALRPVQAVAQGLGLRAMTFPIANFLECRESDLLCRVISPQRLSSGSGLADEARRTLSLQDRPLIFDGLTNQELAAFISLYTRFKGEFGTSEQWKRMSGILRASLEGEREQLGDLLSFLTYIEADLRLLLPRLLAMKIGGEWYRTVTTEAGLSGDVAQWTLAEHMAALRWANREVPSVAEFLEQHLGENWTAHLRGVQELRNDYAHGRILSYPRFTTFDGEWGVILERVFGAAKLMKGLRAALKDISSQRAQD